jgi:hypothetical protein
MTRQPFGGSEPLDLEAIRQSPRQFVDLETVEKLSDYAMVCELKIERLERENEAYREERDQARASRDHTIMILVSIHALLYPPRVTGNDGRTWQFKSPLVEEQMQGLSDRIRAIPDEIAAIDATMKGQ